MDQTFSRFPSFGRPLALGLYFLLFGAMASANPTLPSSALTPMRKSSINARRRSVKLFTDNVSKYPQIISSSLGVWDLIIETEAQHISCFDIFSPLTPDDLRDIDEARIRAHQRLQFEPPHAGPTRLESLYLYTTLSALNRMLMLKENLARRENVSLDPQTISTIRWFIAVICTGSYNLDVVARLDEWAQSLPHQPEVDRFLGAVSRVLEELNLMFDTRLKGSLQDTFSSWSESDLDTLLRSLKSELNCL